MASVPPGSSVSHYDNLPVGIYNSPDFPSCQDLLAEILFIPVYRWLVHIQTVLLKRELYDFETKIMSLKSLNTGFAG